MDEPFGAIRQIILPLSYLRGVLAVPAGEVVVVNATHAKKNATAFRPVTAVLGALALGAAAAACTPYSEGCYENDDGEVICPDAGVTQPPPDANMPPPMDASVPDAAGPRDAAVPDARVDIPDARVDIPDAYMPDNAPPPDTNTLARRAFVNNVQPLLSRQPGACMTCHGGQFPPVNYLNVLSTGDGVEDWRQSILAYKFDGYRPYLVDFASPSQSILLIKGAHTGPALARTDDEKRGVIAWVELEKALACEQGVVNCNELDGGSGPGLPALDNSEEAFNTWILPTLLEQNCQYCHATGSELLVPGTMHYRSLPTRALVNFLDSEMTPYRSFVNYVSLGGLQLYDFTTPSASLLLNRGEHQGGEGRPYGRTQEERDAFLVWVGLEKVAQTVPPPPPMDAGVPDAAMVTDAGPTDAGTGPTDAGAGMDAGDLAAKKAAAKEAFFQNIYINLVPPTRPDAICTACHIQGGTGATPFMVRPGGGAALAEDRYRAISENPLLVNLQVPSASLMLLKNENHTGGQGYVRENSADADRAKFLAWVALEREARGMTATASGSGSSCESQFYPTAPSATGGEWAETQVDVALRTCRPELQGMFITVAGRRFGSGFEFGYMSVIAPATKGVQVTDPVFTRWTRLEDADGGIAYTPREVVNAKPGFRASIAPGQLVEVFTEPPIFMPNFFGLGGNPNVGGLTSYISIEFRDVLVDGLADAGPAMQDAGPQVLEPCRNVADFTAQVVPLLQNRASSDLAACTDCHGAMGFNLPRSMMNLSQLGTDPAAACSQVRRWVNPMNAPTSILFGMVNPQSVGNGHGWWFPNNTAGNDAFQAFLMGASPWITSERPPP